MLWSEYAGNSGRMDGTGLYWSDGFVKYSWTFHTNEPRLENVAVFGEIPEAWLYDDGSGTLTLCLQPDPGATVDDVKDLGRRFHQACEEFN